RGRGDVPGGVGGGGEGDGGVAEPDAGGAGGAGAAAGTVPGAVRVQPVQSQRGGGPTDWAERRRAEDDPGDGEDLGGRVGPGERDVHPGAGAAGALAGAERDAAPAGDDGAGA